MNEDQQKAICCLAKFWPLSDPKYAPHPAKSEKELQESVRRCWSHRKAFPAWLEKDYIAKWAKSAPGAHLDLAARTEVPDGDGTAAVRVSQ
jgi:hypothetical protein